MMSAASTVGAVQPPTSDLPRDLLRGLDAALACARAGLRIFPLKDKHQPLTTNGCLDATDDVEQIRRWWGRHPDAGVGAATGWDFVAVDLDRKDGRDGVADGSPLVATPTARANARRAAAFTCGSRRRVR